jgi:hypothetical protein
MKHKVGDKVMVKSLKWWNDSFKQKNITIGEYIRCTPFNFFTESMKKYLGKEVTIKEAKRTFYFIEEDNGRFFWSNHMFEE